MKYVITAVVALSFLSVQCQSILGKWKSIDDETGKEKSIVEIYEEGGKVYGKIIHLFRAPDEVQDPVCDKCEDDRKDQPIKGMVIIRDMQLKEGFFQSGSICDPKNGKIYRCEMWLSSTDSNKLELRGYWGFFYRTQTWLRVS